ncbi:MAG: PAS domain S-box protein, partial [Candidatus Competibacteraceae bacterium]
MAEPDLSHEQLTREVERLRARLADAEEVLRAIRAGEVDALVVPGPGNRQIFTRENTEQPYRVLVEQMNQGAVTLSAEGLILYCNRRFAEIFRTPLDRVAGSFLAAFIEPSDHAALRVLLDTARTGRGSGEIAGRATDGATVPLLLDLSALPAGSAAAIGLVATDLTERKQAEKALQFRNALLTTQQEVSIDGILVVDEKARIVSHNRRFVEMWGIPPELVLSKDDVPVLRFVTNQAADPERFLQRVKHLYKHQRETGQDEVMLKDGRVFERYSAPMLGAEGRYLGRVWYFRDITERKQTEEALQANEAFVHAILDSVGAEIAVLDRNGVILTINEPWRRFALENSPHPGQPTPHTEVGANYLEICRASTGYSAEGAQEALDGILAVLEGRLPHFSLEYPCHSPNRERWFTMNVTPLKNGRQGAVVSHTDITQRKAAENRLQQSEEKLRLFIEHAPAAIVMLDRDLRYLFASRRWATDYRLGDREIIGHSHYEIFPEIPDRWKEIHRRCLAGATERCEADPFPRPDGATNWVRWETRPWYDSSGAIGGIVLMSEDITQQVRAREALRASETHLRTIFRAAPIGIGVVVERIFQEVNQHILEMTGYTREELIGVSTRVLYPTEEEFAYVGKEKYRQIAEKGVGVVETRWRCKDGAIIDVLLSSCSLDLTDHKRGVTFTALDITERKRVEEKLRQLSLAVEQSPESIVITDLGGRIEYVNESFVRITGYGRNEVLGQNPRLLKSSRTPPETYTALWATLKQGQPWTGELINRRKDGREYVESVIIAPIRQMDGRITHYVAVQEDVTEKKRIDAELDRHRHHLEERVTERTAQLAEAREAAEAANQAKSAFLANMSHEIRTPLNAILGLTHLLRQNEPTPAQAERLNKIAAAGRHLLTLLNDILDLSKIEAGKLELEQSDFHLSALLDQVRSLIAEAAQAKGLALVVDSDAVPLWLRGDATRVR